MRPVRRAARAMLGTIFVVSGVRGVASPEQLTDQAKPVTDRIAPVVRRLNLPLPVDTRAMVRLHAATQVLGGLLLANSRLRRPAALLLAASLVPTTLAGHPFWQLPDPAQRRSHLTHALKNLGLMGGLLLAAADTEGRPSLRWRSRHVVESAQRRLHRTARTARREVRLASQAFAAGRHLPG